MTTDITLTVNDETRTMPTGATCRDVIAQTLHKDISEDGRAADGTSLGVALAVNGAVIPRSAWATTPISDGAQVELITAVQGG